MRWFFQRSGTVQRTCLDCGETWTLEAGLAHLARKSRFTTTLRANRSTIRGQPTDYVADAYAQLDQDLEWIRETRTCPKCASEHFKDRYV